MVSWERGATPKKFDNLETLGPYTQTFPLLGWNICGMWRKMMKDAQKWCSMFCCKRLGTKFCLVKNVLSWDDPFIQDVFGSKCLWFLTTHEQWQLWTHPWLRWARGLGHWLFCKGISISPWNSFVNQYVWGGRGGFCRYSNGPATRVVSQGDHRGSETENAWNVWEAIPVEGELQENSQSFGERNLNYVARNSKSSKHIAQW